MYSEPILPQSDKNTIYKTSLKLIHTFRHRNHYINIQNDLNNALKYSIENVAENEVFISYTKSIYLPSENCEGVRVLTNGRILTMRFFLFCFLCVVIDFP